MPGLRLVALAVAIYISGKVTAEQATPEDECKKKYYNLA
jgi:hypothetical protein